MRREGWRLPHDLLAKRARLWRASCEEGRKPLRYVCIVVISGLLLLASFIRHASAQDPSEFQQRFPGLVLGLRHNINQEREDNSFIAFFTARASASLRRMDGGDLGARLHRGYEWWMIDDTPDRGPSLRLPPGIVFGLKHSVNQAAEIITVFGRDSCTGPANFPGFQRQLGGDLGARRGQGYCWYESSAPD
jgi:hypothetical protein